MMELATIGVSILTAVGRASVGWFKNSIKDGKIDFPEFQELAKTILVVVITSILVSIAAKPLSPENSDMIGLVAGLIMNEFWNTVFPKMKTWFSNTFQAKKA